MMGCSIGGCGGKVVARLLCNTHYRRWKRTGTTDDPQPKVKPRCAVAHCERTHFGHGYCQLHYYRLRMNGDPLQTRPPGAQAGSDHHLWQGASITYRGLHLRLNRRRGRARTHRCVDCGQQAEHWAYNHKDPNPIVDDKGRTYSPDIHHYDPRCVTCHHAYDHASAA